MGKPSVPKLKPPAYHTKTMTDTDLSEILRDLQFKNSELKKHLEYVQAENWRHKQKYQSLRKSLLKLTENLERNVQIFTQLADDSKSVLQMGRSSTLLTPVSIQKSLLDRSVSLKTVHLQPSPKPGPSSVPDVALPLMRNTTRRRLDIQPINMHELQESITASESDLNADSPKVQGSVTEGLSAIMDSLNSTKVSARLSTILEEDQNGTKEVTVRLKRLPAEIVEMHLVKNSNSLNHSDLDLMGSFSNALGPNSSSTPLKCQIMETLPNFVSVRKKSSRSQNLKDSKPLLSPKKEHISSRSLNRDNSFKENLSPKVEWSPEKKKVKKMKDVKKETPPKQENGGRAKRKARPVQLKEVSLRKKMRRNE